MIVHRNHGRLRKIFLYGASRGTSDALLATRGLVLATLLGPEAFGAWALFRLAMRYGAFAGLGVPRGLEFVAAKTRAAKDPTEAHSGIHYLHTAQGFILLVFGGISLAALTASFLVGDRGLALALRWSAAAILAEQLWVCGLIYIRASGDLRRYAVAELTNAAFHLSFSALLAPLWGLGGAFAGFVFATVASLALLTRRVRLRPAISSDRVGQLIRVGLPIFFSLFFAVALTTADRLVVVIYGGTALLGLYAFGVAIGGLARSFAWVVRTVVFPEVYAIGGSRVQEQVLQDHLNQTVMPFSWWLSPFLGIMALAMGPLVTLIAPDYVGAVPATRIFIFTGVTAGFASLGSLGVVAAGRQKLLPALSASAFSLNIILSILAINLGFDLQGVAGAALISNGLFGVSILAIVAWLGGFAHPWRFLVMTTLPPVWCTTSVLVITTLRPDLTAASTAGSLAIYGLITLPLLPVMLSEFRRIRGPASVVT